MTKIKLFTCFGFLLIALAGCSQKGKNSDKFLTPLTASSTVINGRIKDMKVEEALEAKEFYKSTDRYDVAIKCIQHILTESEDLDLLAKLNIELIQLYEKLGELEKAEKVAHDYQELYPGTKDLPLAAYYEIKLASKAILASDRDQKKTEETVDLAKKFLENFSNSPHVLAVQKILLSAYEVLIEGEFGVINSYLNKYKITGNQGSLDAANKRLDYVKTNLASFAPGMKIKLNEIETILANAKDNRLFIDRLF